MDDLIRKIHREWESAWHLVLVVFRTLRTWSSWPSMGVQWHWKYPQVSWDVCMGLALGWGIFHSTFGPWAFKVTWTLHSNWGISYWWAEFLCCPWLTNCSWPQVVPRFRWPGGKKIAHCNETWVIECLSATHNEGRSLLQYSFWSISPKSFSKFCSYGKILL